MLGAVAHIMELTKNQATDINRMIFLPQISDSLAQIGAAAALASRYAEPTHVRLLGLNAVMVNVLVVIMSLHKDDCRVMQLKLCPVSIGCEMNYESQVSESRCM
ncbi:hypothetical protein KCU99_g218, partial [Aureobasidium melanogenum]